VSESGNVETTHYLFRSWNIFSSLWHLVHTWIGFYSVDPPHISDHFV